MCMFCAAVPVVGAVGAKLNVEQNHKIALDEDTLASPKPIAVITTARPMFAFCWLAHWFTTPPCLAGSRRRDDAYPSPA